MSSSLSPDQRKALVRNYIETAWNTQEAGESNDVSPPVAAPVGSQPDTPSPLDVLDPPASVYLGAERLCVPLARLRKVVRATFPDIHLTIDDLVVEGEKVVVRWFMQGTDLGGYEGHLPTGRSIRLTGITMMRLDHCTIVEEWNEVDVAGMLSQLGFVYTPQPPRITVRRPGPSSTDT